MAFSINLNEGAGSADTVRVDQHWYLTETRDEVVAEQDPRGRWLWASPGDEVSRADAVRLGALKQQAPMQDKQVPSPGDKQVAMPEDKAGPTDDIDELRAAAEQAGVKVDKRWGVERLQQEIAAAESEGLGDGGHR